MPADAVEVGDARRLADQVALQQDHREAAPPQGGGGGRAQHPADNDDVRLASSRSRARLLRHPAAVDRPRPSLSYTRRRRADGDRHGEERLARSSSSVSSLPWRHPGQQGLHRLYRGSNPNVHFVRSCRRTAVTLVRRALRRHRLSRRSRQSPAPT